MSGSASRAATCRGWLDAELALAGPKIAVALGAVAGEALPGRGFRVRDHRGRVVNASLGEWHGAVLSTIHPSAVLRAPDGGARAEAFSGLVAGLTAAREGAGVLSGARRPAGQFAAGEHG